jgi:hypothetical protein
VDIVKTFNKLEGEKRRNPIFRAMRKTKGRKVKDANQEKLAQVLGGKRLIEKAWYFQFSNVSKEETRGDRVDGVRIRAGLLASLEGELRFIRTENSYVIGQIKLILQCDVGCTKVAESAEERKSQTLKGSGHYGKLA